MLQNLLISKLAVVLWVVCVNSQEFSKDCGLIEGQSIDRHYPQLFFSKRILVLNLPQYLLKYRVPTSVLSAI